MNKYIVYIAIGLFIIGLIWLNWDSVQFNKYKECCEKLNATIYDYKCPTDICIKNAEGYRCDFHNGSSSPVRLVCK